MTSIGGLGGGALGPDLTHAAQRYPGPGLAAVLGNIAFPTMAGPFTNRPLTPQEAGRSGGVPCPGRPGTGVRTAILGGRDHAEYLVGVGHRPGRHGSPDLLLAVFWPRQRQSASARLRAPGAG